MARVPPQSIKKFINGYIKVLEPHIKVEQAILFGSYARGDWRKDSDIDLIIISPDFKKMDFMKRLVWLSRMRRDTFINRAMDILGYTKEEFKRLSKESVVLGEAAEKGVVIER